MSSRRRADQDQPRRSLLARLGRLVWRLVVGLSVTVAVVSVLMNTGPWAWAKFLHGDAAVVAVTSNSMQPVFSARDVLAIRPVDPADLQVGDIATIKRPTGTVVTHRIVKIEDGAGGQVLITTKGDANNVADYDVATGDEVLGVVDGKIPLIGEVMLWLQSALGRIVSFAPVGLVFVFAECRDLWREPKEEVRPVVPNKGKAEKRAPGRHRANQVQAAVPEQ